MPPIRPLWAAVRQMCIRDRASPGQARGIRLKAHEIPLRLGGETQGAQLPGNQACKAKGASGNTGKHLFLLRRGNRHRGLQPQGLIVEALAVNDQVEGAV